MIDRVRFVSRILRGVPVVCLVLACGTTAAGAGVGQLIEDPHFDFRYQAEDWLGYSTDFGGGSGWSDLDAGDHPFGWNSGSLQLIVNSRVPSHNTRLCLPAAGDGSYDFSADLLVQAADPYWPTSLEVYTYPDENCHGGGQIRASLEIEDGQPNWRHLQAAPFQAPSGTRSILIVFTARFTTSAFPVSNVVYLDNVSLVGELPTAVPEHLYIGGPDSPYVHGDKLGRFAIGASWRAYDGSTGIAHPQRSTSDSGSFWFFWKENVELTIKVLDACNLEGHYWVFIAGMTDVEVEIVVRDLWLGTTRSYSNPLGRPFETVTDHDGFECYPPG